MARKSRSIARMLLAWAVLLVVVVGGGSLVFMAGRALVSAVKSAGDTSTTPAGDGPAWGAWAADLAGKVADAFKSYAPSFGSTTTADEDTRNLLNEAAS